MRITVARKYIDFLDGKCLLKTLDDRVNLFKLKDLAEDITARSSYKYVCGVKCREVKTICHLEKRLSECYEIKIIALKDPGEYTIIKEKA